MRGSIDIELKSIADRQAVPGAVGKGGGLVR